jgi:hypothetical protein
MQGIEAGVRIQLDGTRKTDRGPVIMVKAVLPVRDGVPANGWYGLSIKEHKTRINGEQFECYLADFSDAHRTDKSKGWMEFVNPEDRKRWEEWKAKASKVKV